MTFETEKFILKKEKIKNLKKKWIKFVIQFVKLKVLLSGRVKIVYQPLKRHAVNWTFYYIILYYSSSTTFSIKLPFFIRTESPKKWLE